MHCTCRDVVMFIGKLLGQIPLFEIMLDAPSHKDALAY